MSAEVSRKIGLSLAWNNRCGRFFALLLWAGIVLSACDPTAQSKVQGTWHMRVRGLPVLDLVIDPDRTLWLATAYEGLWFMDSHGTLFQVESKITGPFTILDLASDSEGNLWLRSREGEIKVFDRIHWQEFNPPPELDSDEIVAMSVALDGNKWFASKQKLAKLEGEKWYVADLPSQIINKQERVKAIFATPKQETVWIGTDKGGVWSYSGGTWTEHKLLPNADVGGINVFYVDPSDRIWVGSGLGVFMLEAGRWNYCGAPWGRHSPGSILDIIMDREGRVWAGGSEGIGMLLPGSKRWIYFEEQSRRLGNYIADIEIDKDGTIWFAGFLGVIQFIPSGPREVIF